MAFILSYLFKSRTPLHIISISLLVHKPPSPRACGNIGATFESLKQHSTATSYHEQLLSVATLVNDRAAKIAAYSSLGQFSLYWCILIYSAVKCTVLCSKGCYAVLCSKIYYAVLYSKVCYAVLYSKVCYAVLYSAVSLSCHQSAARSLRLITQLCTAAVHSTEQHSNKLNCTALHYTAL